MASDQASQDSLPVSTSKDGTLIASCHCQRVQVKLPSKPKKVNECHCTVCYKYGALWGYYPRNDIVILKGANELQAYLREDAEGHISFNRCGFCGCMMMWLGEGEYAGPEHKAGVNCRMLHESEIQGVEKEVSNGP